MFRIFGKLGLIFKIFVVLFFVGLLYALQVYSPLFKQYTAQVMNTSTEMVAGVKTVNTESGKDTVPDLPEKIQKDVYNSIDAAKQQGLDTKMSDVFGIVGRGKKILEDVRNAQVGITDYMKSFAK